MNSGKKLIMNISIAFWIRKTLSSVNIITGTK